MSLLAGVALQVLGKAAEEYASKLLAGVALDATAGDADALARAAEKALAAWVEEAVEEVGEAHAERLARFLAEPDVRDEVLKPLATGKPADGTRLATLWALRGGGELDVVAITALYARRVRREALADPELRGRLQALLAERQVRVLEDLRGAWPELDLDLYRARVRTRWRTLDLSALVPPDHDDPAPVHVRDVFVPPRVVDRPAERPKDEIPVAATGTALDHVARWPRLVVLGDPGSGKSTLARWLVLSHLDGHGPLGGHLPLLVELRDHRGDRGFLHYLQRLGETQGYGLNAPGLAELLRDRPSLVVFDGLDEVFDPVRRARIAEEIVGFATRFPRARIVVTSRGAGFAEAPFRAADFHLCALAELDDAQIATFVRGWFRATAPPGEAPVREARVLDAIAASPAIALLARNPLLLAILTLLARSRELPRERAGLYEHAVRVLCHGWDLRKHVAGDLDDTRKLALLRRVACRMQEGLAQNRIDEETLHAEVRDWLRTRLHRAPADAERDADAVVAGLRERDFVLCRVGDGEYGFVHRTFLEYLCADAVVRRFEKERTLSEEGLAEWVAERADDDAWREVLRLVCGMVDAPVAARLVERVLDADVLAAVECLGEIAELRDVEATCDRVVGAALQIGEPDVLAALATFGRRVPNRVGHAAWLIQRLEQGAWIDGAHLAVASALWGDDAGVRDAVLRVAARPFPRDLLLVHAFGEAVAAPAGVGDPAR
ncbi:MAG: NACHT domain-containing protein [Myxococcota bacterium]